jgi:hypothetical protein
VFIGSTEHKLNVKSVKSLVECDVLWILVKQMSLCSLYGNDDL